jgi:hypothetical protein
MSTENLLTKTARQIVYYISLKNTVAQWLTGADRYKVGWV